MNNAGSSFLDELMHDTEKETTVEKKLNPKEHFLKSWKNLSSDFQFALNGAKWIDGSDWKVGFLKFVEKELSDGKEIDARRLKEYLYEAAEEGKKLLREKGLRSKEYKVITAQIALLEKMLGTTAENEKSDKIFGENRWSKEMREKLEGPIQDIMKGVWKKIKKVFGKLFETIFGKPKSKAPKMETETKTSKDKKTTPIQANAPPANENSTATTNPNNPPWGGTTNWGSTSDWGSATTWGSSTPFSKTDSTPANNNGMELQTSVPSSSSSVSTTADAHETSKEKAA